MDSSKIQGMDITSLKAVIGDLRQSILPSRFEKAQQPDPETLQLGLRTLEGLIWLEISWHADAPRIVQIHPPRKTEGESTLAKQIQHGLKTLSVIELKQKGFERIIELCLAKRQGGPVTRVLLLELMGRRSNIFLLDKDRKVITLGRQVRRHQSRIRPIGTGDSYAPPPPLIEIAPNSEESFDRWKSRLCLLPISLKESLQKTYQGISPSLALQLASDEESESKELLKLNVLDLSNQEWSNLFKRWKLWLNNIENDNLSFYFNGPTHFQVWNTDLDKLPTERKSSIELGEYFRRKLDTRKLNLISKEVENRLMKAKNSETDLLHKNSSLLKRASKGEKYQEEANRLLSQEYPDSSRIKEVQKLFIKAKKLRRSIPILNERIYYHEQRLKNIQESQIFLDDILSREGEEMQIKLNLIIELMNEVNDFFGAKNNNLKRKNRLKLFTHKPLEFLSPSGLLIQVGRNHSQNEWISIRESSNGDLWFHAQDSPGGHVVLKASSGTAEEEDIQMATDLAALFSKAKGNQKVSVVMAYTGDLQKIPGAMPGTVRYRKEKVHWGIPSRAMKHIQQK